MTPTHKFLLLSGAMLPAAAMAQVSPETIAKREKRKNLTVKEWNTDARSQTRWMDHLTVYDDQGRKIEEPQWLPKRSIPAILRAR